MKNNNILKDLSILMLAFNRPATLIRNLLYLNSFKLNLNILIADSSKKKINLKYKFRYLHIIHLKFTECINPSEKIFKSSKQIRSKYTLICPDDDFLNPEALIKCVEFFNKNFLEYSAIQGKFFQHRKSRTPSKKIFKYLYINNISETSGNPILRVKNYLTGKRSHVFFSINKTQDFVKIWEFISTHIKGGQFYEIMQSVLLFYFGKIKVLDIFYFSREVNSSGTNLNTEKSIRQDYAKKNIDITINEFLKFISYKKNLSFINLKKILYENFNKRFINYQKKIKKNKFLVKIIFRFVMTYIFTFIKKDLIRSSLKEKIKYYIDKFPEVEAENRESRAKYYLIKNTNYENLKVKKK